MKTLFWIAAILVTTLVSASDEKTADKKTDPPKALKVSTKSPSVYLAGSRIKDHQAWGGFGPSTNYPRPLEDKAAIGEPGTLSVMVDPQEPVRNGSYLGLRLRIVNRSQQQVALSAIDSHLYIVQEAQNEKGEWTAIEVKARGTGPPDCVNGPHRVFLDPGEYWSFVAPRYTGPFKTKLRFRLDMGKGQGRSPKDGGVIVYSDWFDGSVNPEQFRERPQSR